MQTGSKAHRTYVPPECSRRVTSLAAIAVTALLAAGCEEDEQKGVSDGRRISELSAADFNSLCEENRRLAPRISAAFEAIDCTSDLLGEPTCKAEREACIAEDAELDPEDVGSCDASGPTFECPDLTVGELRACTEAMIRTLEQLADAFTCDTRVEPTPVDPPACTKLELKCPELAHPFSEDF